MLKYKGFSSRLIFKSYFESETNNNYFFLVAVKINESNVHDGSSEKT